MCSTTPNYLSLVTESVAYDSTDAAEIDGCEERRRGRGGGDQAAWICDTAGHSQVSFQQQSSIATPPTSSESLHEHAHTYSSSGVDSPSPSTSDIKHTPCESLDSSSYSNILK